ncbi:unnamed protein product, partial [marine sediment metagenome]
TSSTGIFEEKCFLYIFRADMHDTQNADKVSKINSSLERVKVPLYEVIGGGIDGYDNTVGAKRYAS